MTLLFGDEANRTLARAKSGPSATISVLFHAGIVTLLLVAGLSTPKLRIPEHLRATFLLAPPLPPPPPPAPVATVRTAIPEISSRITIPVKRLSAQIPAASVKQAAILDDAPPAIEASIAGGVPGGIPGGVLEGVPGGVLGGVSGGLPEFAAPAPPPAPAIRAEAPASAPKRIEVSSEVQEAKLLTMVQPEYPKLAQTARIQGSVLLSAIIDKEGKIVELKVIEGSPFLAESALAAIKRWRYRPTYLNGEPVEIATRIIVRFHLQTKT